MGGLHRASQSVGNLIAGGGAAASGRNPRMDHTDVLVGEGEKEKKGKGKKRLGCVVM
jgi:hypothetical protein